jgi:PhoH-like ATPase
VNAAKRTAGRPAKEQRRLFVLDTNVLMHDPTSIFRFQEHDVYLPMVVLEELDANKKGLSEASRNVRQVSRFLDDLMRDATKDQIDVGLPLPSAQGLGARTDIGPAPAAGPAASRGRAACSSRRGSSPLPCPTIYRGTARTMQSCRRRWRLQALHHEARVTLVPRTSTCASRRAVVGVHAEDYYSDKDHRRRPMCCTPASRPCRRISGSRTGKDMRSWKEAERTYYEISGPVVTGPARQPVRARGLRVGHRSHRPAHSRRARPRSSWARDYRTERHSVWGVIARNREQNFALNLLMDPEIDFVTILGPAGTARPCSRSPPVSCRRWSRTASSRSS